MILGIMLWLFVGWLGTRFVAAKTSAFDLLPGLILTLLGPVTVFVSILYFSTNNEKSTTISRILFGGKE